MHDTVLCSTLHIHALLLTKVNACWKFVAFSIVFPKRRRPSQRKKISNTTSTASMCCRMQRSARGKEGVRDKKEGKAHKSACREGGKGMTYCACAQYKRQPNVQCTSIINYMNRFKEHFFASDEETIRGYDLFKKNAHHCLLINNDSQIKVKHVLFATIKVVREI